MSKLYLTQTGDTFNSLSLSFYGNESFANLIRQANGFRDSDTLPTGLPISLPKISTQENLNINAASEELVLSIDNINLTNIIGFSLVTGLGFASDVLTVTLTWDSSDSTRRELFRPFSYKEVQFFIGKKLKFSGTFDVPTFVASKNDSSTIILICRSRTSVLVDSKMDTFPLEYRDSSLKTITESVLAPFDIESNFETEDSSVFASVKADIGETVFEFLLRLAKRRGLLIRVADNVLTFLEAKTSGVPSSSLEEGSAPVESGFAVYRGDLRFASFRFLSQEPGVRDLSATARDSAIQGNSRFFVRTVFDTNVIQIQDAVRWQRGRSIGDSIQIIITLSGWLDSNEEFWGVNKLIGIKFPSIALYNDTVMLIKTVEFIGDPETSDITRITVTLPETYTKNEPESYPWDL